MEIPQKHSSIIVPIMTGEESISFETDNAKKSTPAPIDLTGDLVLEIRDEAENMSVQYLVSTAVLMKVSAYFRVLLDPTKFAEGIASNATHEKLKLQYGDAQDAPISELPVVQISDAGQFPPKVSNRAAVTSFLKICHNGRAGGRGMKFTMTDMAYVAVVVDRFDATAPVRAYLSVKSIKHCAEEMFHRKRLFIGFLLGITEWVLSSSRVLIMQCSPEWTQTAETASVPGDEYQEPWFHLPEGIEGECRENPGRI
jgi:hypothetical protein